MSDAAPGPDDPAPAGSVRVEPLRRQLGVAGIWLLALNGLIGAGIFGAPGIVAAAAGSYSPHVFVVCGLLLAPVALCFAEVSSGFARTGGPVLYAREAFGPLAGFQTGWTFYITRVSASAANVSLLVATLGYFWPAVEAGAVRVGLLALVCGGLTALNVIGTRAAMRWLGGLTVLKLLPLLALVGFGLPSVDIAALVAPGAAPPESRLATAVMLSIYAFVGWEAALVPAGESRQPARDMPRGLLWALATATALYVVLQAVSLAVLPDLAETAGRPLVAVGAALFGPPGAALLTLGVIASVAGNVSSSTLALPRITYAMARQGLLPRFFGGVHATFRTPAASILVYGAVSFALAATGTFVELAKVSVLTRLLIYLAVIAAVPRLRAREAEVPGRMRLPGGPTVPILAGLVCLGLLLQLDAATFLRAAVYLAVGSLLYLVARAGEPPRESRDTDGSPAA